MATIKEGQTCVVPGAQPCDPAELAPLVEALRAGVAVEEPTAFPRGTLLPDGRLDLCKQSLGPEGARLVAEALADNRVVTAILCGADGLGNEGALRLAELLDKNSTLTTVFLGCNRIDASGAGPLVEAAARGRAPVRGLWLKRNPLGAAGIAAVARALPRIATLRTLDLAQTQLGEAGAAREALARAVAAHPALERLYLSGNALTAEDVEWIALVVAPGSRVGALYLTANRLGDAGVAALAPSLRAHEALVTLALGSNGIGPEGIARLAATLAGHPRLDKLELGRAPSTAVLGVEGNRLDAAAIDALAAMAEATPSLTQVTYDARIVDGAAARARLDAALAHNRAAKPPTEPPAIEDVRAIRSVYRTARASISRPATKTAPAPAPAPVPDPPSDSDLATAARVLAALAAQPGLVVDGATAALKSIRGDANRLIERVRAEVAARKQSRRKAASRADRAANREHDRAAASATAIRATDRIAAAEAPIVVGGVAPEPPARVPVSQTSPGSRALRRSRRCYVCKQRYQALHLHYDSLCPTCAEESWARRHATADLRGRRALLTGGRVKIGHEVALGLLRSGAEVIVTTRFPCDAARRFAGAWDFDAFRDRLRIVGLDLRHLDAVERFAATLAAEVPHLDILVNNAAQTVRRPSAWWEALVAAELRGPAALPPTASSIVEARSPHGPPPSRLLGDGAAPPPSAHAALLTQAALHPEDRALGAELFRASDGSFLDPRARNSWALSLDEVEPIELVETAFVGALAPFLLVRRLLPLLERSPSRDRYVVNVTAMEGKFDYANKRPHHPHTNMAKAALNMLTRTAGPELVARGIYMTSVDTGWVTNEQPHPIAERMRDEHGFATPLDERDGAARVLHPIYAGVQGAPLAGCLLKDYRVATW